MISSVNMPPIVTPGSISTELIVCFQAQGNLNAFSIGQKGKTMHLYAKLSLLHDLCRNNKPKND